MNCSIAKISTVIPSTKKTISIELNGKNLIFVGGNGTGKTQLLNILYGDLQRKIIALENDTPDEIQKDIDHAHKRLNDTAKTDAMYDIIEGNIAKFEARLLQNRNCSISITDLEEYVTEFQAHKSLALLFSANRQVAIRESTSAKGANQLIAIADQKRDNPLVANLFEDYLVSLKAKQAYAESTSINNDPASAEKIKLWFEKLENDFRTLFEDNSITLRFQSENSSFLVDQKGKSPYRLQHLSSGFSSVLAIYAELLMRVELRSIHPNEIRGVVLIDEIDAHLHVSLQRKIFSFLTQAFPAVQFIISTHSPFVVASVSNALIYDLSSNELVDDLSMYSYESIVEGLFSTPTSSKIARDKITAINEVSNSPKVDIDKLQPLIDEIAPHEQHLDGESNFFLQKAKLILNKIKSRG